MLVKKAFFLPCDSLYLGSSDMRNLLLEEELLTSGY